jgi:hypothetical protein
VCSGFAPWLAAGVTMSRLGCVQPTRYWSRHRGENRLHLPGAKRPPMRERYCCAPYARLIFNVAHASCVRRWIVYKPMNARKRHALSRLCSAPARRADRSLPGSVAAAFRPASKRRRDHGHGARGYRGELGQKARASVRPERRPELLTLSARDLSAPRRLPLRVGELCRRPALSYTRLPAHPNLRECATSLH